MASFTSSHLSSGMDANFRGSSWRVNRKRPAADVPVSLKQRKVNFPADDGVLELRLVQLDEFVSEMSPKAVLSDVTEAGPQHETWSSFSREISNLEPQTSSLYRFVDKNLSDVVDVRKLLDDQEWTVATIIRSMKQKTYIHRVEESHSELTKLKRLTTGAKGRSTYLLHCSILPVRGHDHAYFKSKPDILEILECPWNYLCGLSEDEEIPTINLANIIGNSSPIKTSPQNYSITLDQHFVKQEAIAAENGMEATSESESQPLEDVFGNSFEEPSLSENVEFMEDEEDAGFLPHEIVNPSDVQRCVAKPQPVLVAEVEDSWKDAFEPVDNSFWSDVMEGGMNFALGPSDHFEDIHVDASFESYRNDETFSGISVEDSFAGVDIDSYFQSEAKGRPLFSNKFVDVMIERSVPVQRSVSPDFNHGAVGLKDLNSRVSAWVKKCLSGLKSPPVE